MEALFWTMADSIVVVDVVKERVGPLSRDVDCWRGQSQWDQPALHQPHPHPHQQLRYTGFRILGQGPSSSGTRQSLPIAG